MSGVFYSRLIYNSYSTESGGHGISDGWNIMTGTAGQGKHQERVLTDGIVPYENHEINCKRLTPVSTKRKNQREIVTCYMVFFLGSI